MIFILKLGLLAESLASGGEGGIRTLDGLAPMLDFENCMQCMHAVFKPFAAVHTGHYWQEMHRLWQKNAQFCDSIFMW